ncbi:transglycosylase domain-containing protein [Desulfotalea psychrophila]|nr:transglycosylase domain-containing protein [Desulfotalea psychrophila]
MPSLPAEDNRFFDHFGFDVMGISRAMITNVRAGRIVQGGSTLTQQTAKNLFKRADRSIKEKLKELLFALRLEYHYSKEQIFEFYANQFYVSGNGHGLGIAARYYFNKSASELNLVESAFIAGSVKGPNYYNPFTKKTTESIEEAKKRANIRLAYVLRKMKKEGMIGEDEFNRALAEGVPFNKGQFGYELDYTMELVRDAVVLPQVTEALAAKGIDNISTSGVAIITSIDKDLQQKTLFGLRRHLSDLDVRLNGYQHNQVQEEIKALNYQGDLKLDQDAFLFGKVIKIETEDKTIKISVSFGPRIGQGVIDAKGLIPLTNALVQWRKNRWAQAKAKDRQALLEQIEVGDTLWVSVREIPETGVALLDLRKYPTVQGGALVSHAGSIKSVAGGSENRFYNRAIYAERPMGSTFKPFLFTAALQLGWNSAAPLNNSRNIFVYQGMPYYPRPDHISPYPQVSMSWAGTKSENVACIWLLYHLTDHLSKEEFYDLALHTGFSRTKASGGKESYRNFHKRIRDKYGIIVTRKSLQEAAYQQAISNIETDFLFENMEAEYKQIKGLQYGLGFKKFKEELAENKRATRAERRKEHRQLSTREKNEYTLREKLLDHSFLAAAKLKADLNLFKANIKEDNDIFDFFQKDTIIYSKPEEMPDLYLSSITGKYHFGYKLNDNEEFHPLSNGDIQRILVSMTSNEKHSFWQEIQLDEMLSVAAFDMLETESGFEYKKLSKKLPYDFEVLSKVRDFRVAVGLHYLISLAREMGIASQLEPVLSFPLGSNSITLLEAVSFYETIITGKAWSSSGKQDDKELAIIDRIESSEGDILFQAQSVEQKIVDAQTSLSVSNILENTVNLGTGRAAKKSVRLSSADEVINQELRDLNIPVPLLGKTGTANNYTNASFIGYVPGFDTNSKKITLENGYTIGVYTGYDNNKPMKHKTVRIAGSTGALPIWSTIANQLLLGHNYGDQLNLADLSFDGLKLSRPQLGQVSLAMNIKDGGLLTTPSRLANNRQPAIITFAREEGNRLKLEHYYRPFWQVKGETKDPLAKSALQ